MSSFWDSSAFRARFGRGARWADPTEAELASAAELDPLLAELLSEDGWASYEEGLLWTTPAAPLAPHLAPWIPSGWTLPLLRSGWGHVIVLEVDRARLIDPLYGGHEEYPMDPVSVLDALLVTDEVLEDGWLSGLYRRAVERTGPPGPTECLCFSPPLALGGSPDVNTVQRRLMAATLDILIPLCV